MPDIVSIGECMIELFADEPLADTPIFHKSYGGDTLNLLVAASRLGSSTGYVTKVGDDPFASFLVNSWQEEGIDISRVRRVSGFNGLYFISLLPGGEREFTYYRKGSAASTLTPDDLDTAYLAGARLLHVSGITQALSSSCRATVLAAVKIARDNGVMVSFDPNLRLPLWSLSQAQAALHEVLPYVDIVLPSAPEETLQLVGAASPEAAIDYFWRQGVKTVAVKVGRDGCVVGADGNIVSLPAVAPNGVLDTTGAGDAFNGGFLHGIVSGMSPVDAARVGVVVAGLKLAGRGAVTGLPRREQVERILSQREIWLDNRRG